MRLYIPAYVGVTMGRPPGTALHGKLNLDPA